MGSVGQVRSVPSSPALKTRAHHVSRNTAKSTISRLNEPPSEREKREKKLAEAVRVLLEGIGEDPAREGLLKTPERYAQALLWMTKGYEDRLSGESKTF